MKQKLFSTSLAVFLIARCNVRGESIEGIPECAVSRSTSDNIFPNNYPSPKPSLTSIRTNVLSTTLLITPTVHSPLELISMVTFPTTMHASRIPVMAQTLLVTLVSQEHTPKSQRINTRTTAIQSPILYYIPEATIAIVLPTGTGKANLCPLSMTLTTPSFISSSTSATETAKARLSKQQRLWRLPGVWRLKQG